MAVIKLYDLLESIIQETGENTAEPYTATRVPILDEYGHVKYTWETENNVSYAMSISKEFTYETDDCVYEISFGIIDPETEKVDTTVTSKSGNVGNMRRVMATVIKYVKEELARDTKNGWQVSLITMSPTKETNFDDRRKNLYLAYIKKNMPAGARVDYNDAANEIAIHL